MSQSAFIAIFPFWIKAFALTLVMEVPVFILLGRKLHEKEKRVSTLRLALAGALGTCITHPLLWFVWPRVVHDYVPYLISGELIVAVVESITFYWAAKALSFRRAALVSFAANGVSFGLGAALQSLIY